MWKLLIMVENYIWCFRKKPLPHIVHMFTIRDSMYNLCQNRVIKGENAFVEHLKSKRNFNLEIY